MKYFTIFALYVLALFYVLHFYIFQLFSYIPDTIITGGNEPTSSMALGFVLLYTIAPILVSIVLAFFIILSITPERINQIMKPNEYKLLAFAVWAFSVFIIVSWISMHNIEKMKFISDILFLYGTKVFEGGTSPIALLQNNIFHFAAGLLLMVLIAGIYYFFIALYINRNFRALDSELSI